MGEGGNGGDGLNGILGMKPSAGDWHDYKKYRCISPVSGIKKIYVEDDRFDFKSEHFLSDRFRIILRYQVVVFFDKMASI